MPSSTLLLGPAVEPVLPADAMLALRIDAVDLLPDLTLKLLAAREAAEFQTGRAFITQTRRLTLRSWPDPFGDYGPSILLDHPPVQSIVALNYWSETGWLPLQTSALEVVQVNKVTWLVVLLDGKWPPLASRPGHRIRLDFKCGFGDSGADVPEVIRQFITSSAGHALADPAGDGDAPNEYIARQLDGWRVWL